MRLCLDVTGPLLKLEKLKEGIDELNTLVVSAKESAQQESAVSFVTIAPFIAAPKLQALELHRLDLNAKDFGCLVKALKQAR